jgi:hypothetical protein
MSLFVQIFPSEPQISGSTAFSVLGWWYVIFLSTKHECCQYNCKPYTNLTISGVFCNHVGIDNGADGLGQASFSLQNIRKTRETALLSKQLLYILKTQTKQMRNSKFHRTKPNAGVDIR